MLKKRDLHVNVLDGDYNCLPLAPLCSKYKTYTYTVFLGFEYVFYFSPFFSNTSVCKINVYESLNQNWIDRIELSSILFHYDPVCCRSCSADLLHCFWPSLFSLNSLASFILSSLFYPQMDMMIFAVGLLFQLKSLLWVQSKNLSTFFYK